MRFLAKTSIRVDWLSLNEYAAHGVYWSLPRLLANLMQLGDHGTIKLAQEIVWTTLVFRQRRTHGGIKLDERRISRHRLLDAGLRGQIEAEAKLDHRADNGRCSNLFRLSLANFPRE